MTDGQQAASFLSRPVGWTLYDILGFSLLFISVAGNVFQWYQQYVYSRTIYNALVAGFNSIGWLLARTMQRTQDLAQRTPLKECQALADEFRHFSLETEYHLRVLHEQLVAPAKILRSRDRRWQAGEFGYTSEEIRRLREMFTRGAQS